MMCETTRQLHEDNERDNLYNLIQYIKYKIYYNLKLWRLSYRSLYTCNRYVARARHKGSPGAHLSSLTREQLTRARAQLTRPPAAPSGAGGDKRDGRPSGNVPANIIRSRDTRILIRVGGVSHDSATLCQSSVYAAAFSLLLWQRRKERGSEFSWQCDSRVPARDGHSILGVNRVETRWDVSILLGNTPVVDRVNRNLSLVTSLLVAKTYCWRRESLDI